MKKLLVLLFLSLLVLGEASASDAWSPKVYPESFVRVPIQNNYLRASAIGVGAGLIGFLAAPRPTANKLLNLGLFFSVGFGSSIGIDMVRRNMGHTTGGNLRSIMIEQQKKDLENAIN